jgi:drug/metabolite transporter (DMT)-like permease
VAAHFHWTSAAWGGWLFLVLFGSLVAFTSYLRLIAAWGAARAGSYAYVSPVIAVGLGMLVMGEQVGTRDVLGMACLLIAAFWSLRASVPSARDSCHRIKVRPVPSGGSHRRY